MIRARIRAHTARKRMRQIRNHIYPIAIFFERLQRLGKLETGAFLRRSPFVHRRPVRNVDAAEPALRRRGRFS